MRPNFSSFLWNGYGGSLDLGDILNNDRNLRHSPSYPSTKKSKTMLKSKNSNVDTRH
jgi:hypothetical protein